MGVRSIIFGCIFLGFYLLFRRIRWLEENTAFLQKTQNGMEEAARKRSLLNRRNLLQIHKEYSFLLLLERQLSYAGLNGHFPFYCVEIWIVCNVTVLAGVFLAGFLLSGGVAAAAAVATALGGEYLFFKLRRARAMRSVNDNLMKFLDFLGNYSITAGEVTGILNQVSKYMDEPLRSALDQCYYEAQITGDAGLALLSMAEKIEHPKFKELARNLEISIRYCADFTALVQSSRKNIREYLRNVEEQKSMLREGMLNMLLLLAMSGAVLLMADSLIEVSVWEILFHTLPGRAALGILAVVVLLFLGKINRIH